MSGLSIISCVDCHRIQIRFLTSERRFGYVMSRFSSVGKGIRSSLGSQRCFRDSELNREKRSDQGICKGLFVLVIKRMLLSFLIQKYQERFGRVILLYILRTVRNGKIGVSFCSRDYRFI